MENIRNRVDIRLKTDSKSAEKLAANLIMNEPQYSMKT